MSGLPDSLIGANAFSRIPEGRGAGATCSALRSRTPEHPDTRAFLRSPKRPESRPWIGPIPHRQTRRVSIHPVRT